MSETDCPHSDVTWNLNQAEETEQDVFVVPGQCEDCGEAVACRAEIEDWWEENSI